MSRRSDLLRGAVAALLVVLAACGRADAALPLPQLPDDELLDQAAEQVGQGQTQRAAELLLRVAEAGHVVAMERLAMMHWYGHAVGSAGPWSLAQALHWFGRAAEGGSAMSRHMVKVVQRGIARDER